MEGVGLFGDCSRRVQHNFNVPPEQGQASNGGSRRPRKKALLQSPEASTWRKQYQIVPWRWKQSVQFLQCEEGRPLGDIINLESTFRMQKESQASLNRAVREAEFWMQNCSYPPFQVIPASKVIYRHAITPVLSPGLTLSSGQLESGPWLNEQRHLEWPLASLRPGFLIFSPNLPSLCFTRSVTQLPEPTFRKLWKFHCPCLTDDQNCTDFSLSL